MSTDLFSKYYNNPSKSYIYANILCNNDSADELSFDINESNGEISDNSNVLSSIDLSDVHVGLSQYTSNSRILQPNEFFYIRGWSFGESYCSKSYGSVDSSICEDEDWMYKGMLFFVIRYLNVNTGRIVVESIKCTGNIDEDITFIDTINNYFEKREIPINASFDEGYVVFTSTKLDYEFWIDHVLLWVSDDGTDVLYYVNQWMIDNNHSYDYGWDDGYANGEVEEYLPGEINVYASTFKRGEYSRIHKLYESLETDFTELIEENNIKKVYLFEDLRKYVPSKRYKNGAMLGVVLDVVYPKYNTEDIEPIHKSVKVAHIADRVQEFYANPKCLLNGNFVATRKIVDVNDLFQCEYDKDLYNRWMGFYKNEHAFNPLLDYDTNYNTEDSSISCIECGRLMERRLMHREQMGVEGYCAYLSKTNTWMTVGQFYARTTIPDDPNYPDVRNLIPSVIVYNPNPFPVQVKYLAFA